MTTNEVEDPIGVLADTAELLQANSNITPYAASLVARHRGGKEWNDPSDSARLMEGGLRQRSSQPENDKRKVREGD